MDECCELRQMLLVPRLVSVGPFDSEDHDRDCEMRAACLGFMFDNIKQWHVVSGKKTLDSGTPKPITKTHDDKRGHKTPDDKRIRKK